MKKIALLMLVCFMCFGSTGCNKGKTPSDTPKEKYSSNYIYCEDTDPRTGKNTLYRYNVLSGTGSPACPDPLCSHGDEKCPFYLMSTEGLKFIGKDMYYLCNIPRETGFFVGYDRICHFDFKSGKFDILYAPDDCRIQGMCASEDYIFYSERKKDGDVYSISFYRLDTGSKKSVCIAEGIRSDDRIYNCRDGKLYFESAGRYYSTDEDYKNRIDGDSDLDKHYADHSLILSIKTDLTLPLTQGFPYACDLVSRNDVTGEEKKILDSVPPSPMTSNGKIFYFQYQPQEIIIGYGDNDPEKPITDPRGYKLYICNYDGSDARELCDISGNGYVFNTTNNVIGQSTNGDYFALSIRELTEKDHVPALGRNALLIVNVNTGEYKIAIAE